MLEKITDHIVDPGHIADIEFIGGPHHHVRLILCLPCQPHVGTTVTLPFMRLAAMKDLGPDDPLPRQEATYCLEPKGARWLGIYKP